MYFTLTTPFNNVVSNFVSISLADNSQAIITTLNVPGRCNLMKISVVQETVSSTASHKIHQSFTLGVSILQSAGDSSHVCLYTLSPVLHITQFLQRQKNDTIEYNKHLDWHTA